MIIEHIKYNNDTVIEFTIIIIIIYITVPVITVTLTPAGDNNVVDIIQEETQTLTCTTDPSRPVAWIQWYIGGHLLSEMSTVTFKRPDEYDGKMNE
jgi:hypothetical protein